MSAQPTVTITRVESWLKSEGVGYEVASDGNLLTGFDSCTVSIVDCDSNFLMVLGSWRGEFAAADAPALAAYVERFRGLGATE